MLSIRLILRASARHLPKHESTTRLSLLARSSKLGKHREFHIHPALYKGITPSSSDPPAPHPTSTTTASTASSTAAKPSQPTEISIEEFHSRSDAFLDSLVSKLEAMQEERDDVDVEYTAGVLTLSLPPAGTYVINKQPPNKQIWLSSPVSGPKRFDWVVQGEGMHQKEGCGSGEWVYLRDGSTLSDLVRREMGAIVDLESEAAGLQ